MEDPAADPASSAIHAEVIDCIPHLRAFARSVTRDRARADELAQEAIARALAASEQFTPGTNFKAWIFTILRNLYYNEGRDRWAKMRSIDDPGVVEPSTPPTQEASLEFCDFRRAFWQLGHEQREVLILIGASGLSYEEAAETCHCPIGTIKSRVSRARSDLLRLLAGDQVKTPRSNSPPVSGTAAIETLASAPAAHANNK